jgi:hypothetical protein
MNAKLKYTKFNVFVVNDISRFICVYGISKKNMVTIVQGGIGWSAPNANFAVNFVTLGHKNTLHDLIK